MKKLGILSIALVSVVAVSVGSADARQNDDAPPPVTPTTQPVADQAGDDESGEPTRSESVEPRVTDETTTTTTTTATTATTEVAVERVVPVFNVLAADATCPAFDPSLERVDSLTAYDMVCVDVPDGESLTPGENMTADGADGRLVIDDGFAWTDENLPSEPASFTLSNDETGQQTEVLLTLRPQIDLTATFSESSDLTGSEPLDAGQGETTTTLPAEVASDVVIGQSPVTKTLTLTGADRDVPGLTIRDEVSPSQLRATVEGEAIESDEGQISIPATGTSTTYVLRLAEGANFGTTTVAQRATVFYRDTQLAVHDSTLLLESPSVAIEVQALAEVVGGDDTIVSVRVTNQREQVVKGPLIVSLEPATGDGLVSGFDDLSEGNVDGNTVTWELPAGLAPEEQVVRSIQVDLNPGSSQARIDWQGSLTRTTAADPIVVDTTSTDVRAGGDTDGPQVPFTPAQLIRLIAFVMAFALVAVIFGAWTRSTNGSAAGATDSQRESELRMFRAYTEAILVLVILVAILVLALRGSLSGESAASLIGVIAGYALGQSRGAK